MLLCFHLAFSVANLDCESSGRIQKEPVCVWPRFEVEHVLKRTGLLVKRLVTNSSQMPVIFDKTQDRSLVGRLVIDKVGLCPRRNDEQRQARSVSTATLVGPGSSHPTTTGAVR